MAIEDEAMARYVKKFSPLNVKVEGRIVITNETRQEREWDLVEMQSEGAWPQEGRQLGFARWD